MNYQSTRDGSCTVSAAQAIAQGISKEGGLFVPERFPSYSYSDLCAMEHLDYAGRARKILGDFLSDFTAEEISQSVERAYSAEKFGGSNPAPLVLLQNGQKNMYLLELWHGPTCAFKDMALQLLPQLLTHSLKKVSGDKTAVILVATSGDTGKAALDGFRDVPGTEIIVFYPQDGVSAMQQRQMCTQQGDNVHVCAVQGNFDDAQTGVKRIFTDTDCISRLAQNNMLFSSANSINWGRLVPQIVYYFSAYCDLMGTGEMDYEGEKVNIVVPTGNFGNILAAYYAMKMGLPVNRLICASNQNNVLTDFIKTGVYDKNREFYTTISPSMDILVSSNLERLLFDLTNRDAEKVAGWMSSLAQTGRYEVDSAVKERLSQLFYSGYCDDAATKETIRMLYETENYLCDPHTAVAVNVYHQYVEQTGDRDTPAILVSTASPYKFAPSVLSALEQGGISQDGFELVNALSAMTGTVVPEPILALRDREIRFSESCSVSDMKETVLNMLHLC
jgi:threonine synthase